MGLEERGDAAAELSKIPAESSSVLRDSQDLELNQKHAPRVPWWSYIWDYDPGRSHEERVFLQKLDVFLITSMYSILHHGSRYDHPCPGS